MGVNTEPYNRKMHFASVRKVADADFPRRWGHFRILGFEGVVDNPESCNERCLRRRRGSSLVWRW